MKQCCLVLEEQQRDLFELENSTACNLTIDLDVYLISARSKRTRAQIVDVLTAIYSMAETRRTGFCEIVGDYFPVLHLELCSRHCLLFKTSPNDSEQHAGNDSSPSQEGFVEIKLAYHH